MNRYTKPLENAYVSRWLVSEIHCERITGKPVTIDTEANVWEGPTTAGSHENPIRKVFLEEKTAAPVSRPEFLRPEPEGTVRLHGQEHLLHMRFPFADPVVAVSGFWSTPTWISATALTVLDSPVGQTIEIELGVRGGMSLWLDDIHAVEFRPYRRNELVFTRTELNLRAGLNILVAEWDEFAERDTECSFSLKITDARTMPLQSIPVGARDIVEIENVEHAMDSLCFTRNHFTEGDITVFCDHPYTDRPFTVEFTGATEENGMLGILHKASATFPAGEAHASLGPCTSFPIGFLKFSVMAQVEGMQVSSLMTMENFPMALQPAPLGTVRERKTQAFEFLARYGEQNANRAVALLHTGGDRQEIETILRKQIDFINRRSDCSDFYLPYFPHIIRTFTDSGLVSAELLSEMKHCILNFRYWHDEPGDDAMWFYSENHALMFHVCQLICGELYPHEIFTNSGMTGEQMQGKAVNLLTQWFDTFFAQGFTEWNSPPYLPINSLGFASLYAQTSHKKMKELARRALDYLHRLLAVNSLEGIFCTTAGRTYLKELMGSFSNCPSFINLVGYGHGNLSHAGKGITALCFSDYEPPAEYDAYHRVPDGSALIWQSTQGYQGYADIYTYKTSRCMMSSANDFNPGRRGFQEDVFHLLFSATEQVWINHPGEFAAIGSARPSYWAGSGTLPRTNQYKRFASVIFSVSPEHPVGFTHAYVPLMEFSRWDQDGRWLFLEAHNGGWCAIFNSQGLDRRTSGRNSNREFISRSRSGVWLVRASGPDEFPTYESFKASMLTAQLDTDGLSYVFDDPCLGRLSAGWDSSLRKDGGPMQYKGFSPEGTIVRETL